VHAACFVTPLHAHADDQAGDGEAEEEEEEEEGAEAEMDVEDDSEVEPMGDAATAEERRAGSAASTSTTSCEKGDTLATRTTTGTRQNGLHGIEASIENTTRTWRREERTRG